MAAKATINELFGSDSDEEEEQVDTQVRITHMLKPTSIPNLPVLITSPMSEHDMDAACFMHSARILKVMCHISRQGNLPSQLLVAQRTMLVKTQAMRRPQSEAEPATSTQEKRSTRRHC